MKKLHSRKSGRQVNINETHQYLSMLFEWIAIPISMGAFLISFVSLWKTHLAPFKLEMTYGRPTFTIYKKTLENSGTEQKTTYWIPSFDVGVSFHNTGQKTGQVLCLKIIAEPRNNSKKFVFGSKWIVNYNSLQKHSLDRQKWSKNVIDREWYPLILSGNETKHVHVVFEMMQPKWWDKKEIIGSMDFSIKVLSSETKKWKEGKRYTTLGMFNELGMYDKTTKITVDDPELDSLRYSE